MSLENILWGVGIFSGTLLIITIFQTISKQKLKNELSLLNNEVEDLKQEKERTLQKKKTFNISPNLEYIKKVESLEKALDREKKRVDEVKSIAQEANRVKAEFLANVRHEIRTPMNSIMVFAGLLAEELRDTKLQSYAQNINTSGEQLLNLLDDIIELSSVENKTFKIEEKATDIKSMLDHIVKTLQEPADKKALKINLDIDEHIPESVMIDRDKVEEIFINLLDNAIRFTDHGTVDVKLILSGENVLKNAVHLTFIVKDSGIGIDSEHLDKIFQIFEKPMQNDDKIRGAGLSLSINKKMANAMGGDITVTSKIGQGSTFTFELKDIEVVLPSKIVKKDGNLNFSRIEAKHNRFIVIDTDIESYEIIKNAFSSTPIEIISYKEPRNAIAQLQKEYFDIIFIDLDMLTADDNAVAKILTKISTAPIVTLITHRLKDVVFIKDIRLAGHLKKPIILEELFRIALNAVEYKEEQTPQKIKPKIKKEEVSQINLEDIAKFLEDVEDNVSLLYKEASKTNDLASIEKFAKRLQISSKYNKVPEMESFADLLLEKVALFDIEAVHNMMQEYQEKIQALKNL